MSTVLPSERDQKECRRERLLYRFLFLKVQLGTVILSLEFPIFGMTLFKSNKCKANVAISIIIQNQQITAKFLLAKQSQTLRATT